MTVTEQGCVHLATPAGTRWVILPWGVQLAGTPDGGVLQRFTGDPVAELNREVTFNGSEIAGREVEHDCGTGLPPFYLTTP
ncbi:hypothetical protein [Nocardioides sp. B-3]|uniref:hypothetical protein n=1 Tax=Nocardioides sp. B-3 TaxID=2895565 RepID=UPI002152C4F2|nr:hypothetical protein [Nocardioides sp. B-3]UUZ58816.1 hypothetical protein LP418_22440 [Nocardioides sp. B-3]